MFKGCFAASAICLVYFSILYFGAAHTINMDWLWLMAGGALFLYGVLLVLVRQYRGWRRFLETVLVLGMLILAYFLGRIIQNMYTPAPLGLDYVLVLGAKVNGRVPSRSLRMRLEKALAYAEQSPDTILVLSGGQGEGEEISEAACMREYLLAHGVEAERLVPEENSTSTWENLSFSNTLTGCAKKRTGILSNSFHICRSLAMARKQGYAEVFGISASSPPWILPHFIFREILALIAQGYWLK